MNWGGFEEEGGVHGKKELREGHDSKSGKSPIYQEERECLYRPVKTER